MLQEATTEAASVFSDKQQAGFLLLLACGLLGYIAFLLRQAEKHYEHEDKIFFFGLVGPLFVMGVLLTIFG